MLAFSIKGSAAMADELKIEVMQEGNDDVAEHGQRVTVHYEGRLTDGTVFDASRPRGQPFSFIIGAGQVIQGWEKGVAGMKIGEMRRLIIPASLVMARLVLAVLYRQMQHWCLILMLAISMPVSLGQATPADLLRAQKDGVVIVDIRRPDEWSQTGVIAGAKTVTAFETNGCLHPEFQQKFIALVPSPDTPVLLYCRSGSRTANLGTALLEQLGFSQVTHLRGGILSWKADGYDTIDYEP